MFRTRKSKLTKALILYCNKFSIFIISLFIGLMYSCEYQLSEIPESIVEKPSENGPSLTIEVTPNMDTLRLASDVLTEFKLSSSERNAEWVKIYFDENLIFDEKYNPSILPQYFIEVSDFSEGLHQFKIQAFMSTNSGSIAEQLGTENYFYEMEWTVFIKHNVSVEIKNAQFENGVVIFDWTKYDFWGFQKYTVTKESNLEGNEFEGEIFNPYFNKVTDSLYIEGEIANYGIKLNDGHTRKFKFQIPITSPVVQLNEKNELLLNWEKSQNQKNWESYYIQSKYELNGYIEHRRIYDADSTCTIFKKIGFGRPYEFQVRYIPKTFTGEYLNFISSGGITKFSLGNEMPIFEAGFALPESSYLLLYNRVNNKDRFYKYNITTNQIEDSVQVEGYVTDNRKICISPNGEYFSYYTHLKFVVHKTSDFSIVNQFYVPFLNYGNLLIYSSHLSNYLKLFVVDHDDTFKVIDVVTGKEIFRKTDSDGNSIHTAKVNDSSDRILFEKSEVGKSVFTLCSFENNELKVLAKIDTDEQLSDAEGYFGNGKLIITHSTGFWKYEVQVRNIVDLTIEKTVEIPYHYKPFIICTKENKIISKYASSGDGGHSYMTDIESGNSSKIYPVLGWGSYILYNNFLYTGIGRNILIDKLLIHD